MHSLRQGWKAFIGLALQLIVSATATNGTAIDCIDLGLNCSATLILGTQTGTIASDVKMQESDASGSGFADIAGAVFSTTDENDDDTIAAIDFVRTKRFIRVVDTTVGTITAHNVAVTVDVEAAKQGTEVNSPTAA